MSTLLSQLMSSSLRTSLSMSLPSASLPFTVKDQTSGFLSWLRSYSVTFSSPLRDCRMFSVSCSVVPSPLAARPPQAAPHTEARSSAKWPIVFITSGGSCQRSLTDNICRYSVTYGHGAKEDQYDNL